MVLLPSHAHGARASDRSGCHGRRVLPARRGRARAGPCRAASGRAAAGRRRGAGAGGGVVRGADPQPRLRVAAAGAPGRYHPPGAGPGHQPAPGRRQGRAVFPARFRRGPRHRRGDLRGRHARQPALACARAGLRRPALPDPGDGPADRGAEGAVPRRARRLRHGGRGQLRAARHSGRERHRVRRRHVRHAAPSPAGLADARRAEDADRRRGLRHRRPVRA